MFTLEFTRNELIGDPEPRQLVTGKSVLVFNIISSPKTDNLNSGSKFTYQNELYEIMNRELVDSPKNYIKFNCLRRVAGSPSAVKKSPLLLAESESKPYVYPETALCSWCKTPLGENNTYSKVLCLKCFRLLFIAGVTEAEIILKSNKSNRN
jgi:hypothetical protein